MKKNIKYKNKNIKFYIITTLLFSTLWGNINININAMKEKKQISSTNKYVISPGKFHSTKTLQNVNEIKKTKKLEMIKKIIEVAYENIWEAYITIKQMYEGAENVPLREQIRYEANVNVGLSQIKNIIEKFGKQNGFESKMYLENYFNKKTDNIPRFKKQEKIDKKKPEPLKLIVKTR